MKVTRKVHKDMKKGLTIEKKLIKASKKQSYKPKGKQKFRKFLKITIDKSISIPTSFLEKRF